MQSRNRAADSHELRPLTGVRGVAALLIVFLHNYSAWLLLFPALHYFSALSTHGLLGVDLFFVLSGFILSYVYHAGAESLSLKGYLRFLWFRLARIYPNHLTTLVFLAVLVAGAAVFHITISGRYPLSEIPSQLLLTNSWPTIFPTEETGHGDWNFPNWSISAEWFAYLCIFPIVAYLMIFRLRVVSHLLLTYASLSCWLFFPDSWLTHNNYHSSYSLLEVSFEFFAGAMCFGIYTHNSVTTRLCQKYLSLTVAVILFYLFSQAPSIFRDPIIIVLLFPPLLLGLTSENSLPARMLSTPFALWLGRISYSLYMTHGITEKIMKVVIPSDHYTHSTFFIRLLILSVQILASILGAALLYYVVEIPARNYLRRVRPQWMHSKAPATS